MTARQTGLAELTLREVAARIGMRASSLYSYFGSKHDSHRADVLRLLGCRPGPAPVDEPAHDPGFVPSAEAYAPAVEVVRRGRERLARFGVEGAEKLDLFTALLGGMVNAQHANDPGGVRWARLLDEAMDMFADHVGLPR